MEGEIIPLFQIGPIAITNTIVTTWIVTGFIGLSAWLFDRLLKNLSHDLPA